MAEPEGFVSGNACHNAQAITWILTRVLPGLGAMLHLHKGRLLVDRSSNRRRRFRERRTTRHPGGVTGKNFAGYARKPTSACSSPSPDPPTTAVAVQHRLSRGRGPCDHGHALGSTRASSTRPRPPITKSGNHAGPGDRPAENAITGDSGFTPWRPGSWPLGRNGSTWPPRPHPKPRGIAPGISRAKSEIVRII